MAKLYVVWVEGLSPKDGEKIKSIRRSTKKEKVEYGFGDYCAEYTTLMTDAMRFTWQELEKASQLLGRDLTLDAVFITYAPPGTRFKSKLCTKNLDDFCL